MPHTVEVNFGQLRDKANFGREALLELRERLRIASGVYYIETDVLEGDGSMSGRPNAAKDDRTRALKLSELSDHGSVNDFLAALDWVLWVVEKERQLQSLQEGTLT